MRTGGGLLQRSRTVREGLRGPRHARALPRACVRACVSVRACARARTCRFPSADACPSAQVWSVKFDRSCVVSGSYDKTVKVTFPPQNCACAKRIVTIAKPAAIDRVLTPTCLVAGACRWTRSTSLRYGGMLHCTAASHMECARAPCGLDPAGSLARTAGAAAECSLPAVRYGTARRVHASRRCAATAAG